MQNTDINEMEKLKYLQTKIHEATLECANTYLLAKNDESLFHTFLSLVFMSFRNSVDTSISVPYRVKFFQSTINNIEKEMFKMLTERLPENCTKKDIDEQIAITVKSICKDFLGATIVFHSKNNLDTYCEESDDPYVKKLYKQVLIVEEYLRSEEKDFNLDLLSRLYKRVAKIDISGTFIDDIKPYTPTKVKPLDLRNINTLADYYSCKITLLTLLTNSSMPCTESTDENQHKYCVSEVDVPYLQLVKQAKEINPRSKDEFISILTELAHKSYYRKYTPFDEQLKDTLKEQTSCKLNSIYKADLSPTIKKKYIQELNNLKNNLKQLKNDRLLNYVLKKELPNIFKEISELPNFNIEIKDSKERAKSSGFYACYYTVELNGTVICEILGNSEFRSNLSKEGNAAHNLMPNKSFDIKPLFELRSFPFPNSPKAKEKLDFYCEFLNTVSLNDVSRISYT